MLKSAIIILSTLILISLFGSVHWAADVLSIFTDYLAIILIVLVIIAARNDFWLFAGIGLFFVLAGAVDLINFKAAPISADLTPSARLMVQNIYYENEEVEALTNEIERLDPDLIYLMEYPSNANRVMRLDLEDNYPYQLIEPSRFTMGTAFYSKHPIESSTVHQFPGTRIPIFEIELNINGQPITFVGGHPWPPMPQWGQRHRDQLADMVKVAAAVDQTESPLIVAGDFNISPNAYMLRSLTNEANVALVRNRLDLRKTFFNASVIRFSFDHVFVSEKVSVTGYQFGNRAGSDHLPIIVDFAVQESK